MTNEISSNKKIITNSLSNRFRRSIIWLYIATVIVSIPTVYFLTKYQVYSEANKELSLLVDMVASVREYIAQDVRKDLLDAKLFQSPAISSTVTTSLVANHFLKKQPDYYIKVASDNPLNKMNAPEPLETQFLTQYRADKELKQITQIGEIKGKNFLVSSRPSIAHQECMICHGEPTEAPAPITNKYGTTKGYNYKLNSVVGTMGVGVPLADINTIALQRGMVAVAFITLIFGLIFIIINTLVKKSILEPITGITQAAVALSKGNLDQEINVKQDGSEISELANSFELLRRSLKWTLDQPKE
ncbi:MAG: DUF3365 domain-containing protein [Candidatus Competibacteraceae bacterium]|nr:DUF3365 domain-containing protein [Candidatus Competibacteraceae bacterium]